MESESKYYSPVPVIEYAEKINCPFIAIAGGKGNGKTYGIIQYYLKERIKTGRVLRYLRRYRESISPKAIQSLCKPQRQNLINLTNGKYNDFQYYQSRFWLIRKDDTGKTVAKDTQPFIVCSALNSVEGFTGADEGECSAIFYDEFLSREKEIADEFYNLNIFHNNCTRNRTDYFCPMILVGNTVTRNSSLITNYGINLYTVKKGEITVVKNSKKEPTLVFEYCNEVAVMTESADTYYSRFENDRIKMIYKGDWTIGNYPMLPTQEIQNSKNPVNFKIITPAETALCFEFRISPSNVMFAYVRHYDDDNIPFICTLINKVRVFKEPTTFNFLPSKGIFKHFAKLVYTRNVYFESMEVGEYFRDFLKNFTGCEALINVYK